MDSIVCLFPVRTTLRRFDFCLSTHDPNSNHIRRRKERYRRIFYVWRFIVFTVDACVWYKSCLSSIECLDSFLFGKSGKGYPHHVGLADLEFLG